MSTHEDKKQMPSAELAIHVTPRAASTDLRATEDGTLSARVTAAPTDGQANAAVVELLAKRLGIAKTRIGICAGAASRNKRVRILGLSQSEVLAKLSE